ncbi:MAG: hypothetical protein R3A48_15895 [Polyangiales bacterium]
MRVRVATALLLTACGGELPSPSSVLTPRFIAILTPTPEVRPGQGASFEALFHDPAGRVASFRWWWCWESAAIDPLRCDAASANRELPDQGARATLPGEFLRAPPAADARVIVVCEAAVGAETVTSFRRLRLRAEGPLSTPPALGRTALRVGARELTVVEGGVYEVAGGDVSVTTFAEEGARALTASFLCGAGSFSPPRAVSPSPLTSRWVVAGEGEIPMWVVLRDEGGGASALRFRVRRAR